MYLDVRYGLSNSFLVQNWSGQHQDICEIIHFSSQQALLVEFHIRDRKFELDALRLGCQSRAEKLGSPKNGGAKVRPSTKVLFLP